MKTGQFASNDDIKEQFDQTGATFERTPLVSESLSPEARRAWKLVIGGMVVLTVMCVLFSIAINGG